MVELCPPVEPYDQGMLDVGDGNQVYWETCGNPDGKPAVMVHGGPGQGCVPNMRRTFDPELYGAVLSARGVCGRDTPPGRRAAGRSTGCAAARRGSSLRHGSGAGPARPAPATSWPATPG